MNQLSLFYDQIIIPGLKYIAEYITMEQESKLVELIDNNLWINELKRRVQHYGYKYDYRSRSINQSYYLGALPEWLQILCNILYKQNIFYEIPDQVIINEYMPGQGIASHIDCVPCFSDTICSLSLSSSCVMELTNNKVKHFITLKPRSLLIFKNEARYKWKHGIIARKSDNKIARDRRISLTFRKVIL
ncbi:MAG: alpha-ketoglutarate-dependent dioxygenase AlkB [Rickettsia endosymbiont of Pentastiridius leporinus]